MGGRPARSRRLRLHRSARSWRSHPDRLRARDQRRGAHASLRAAPRVLHRRGGDDPRARRAQEPEAADRRRGAGRRHADDLLGRRDAPLRAGGRHALGRDDPSQAPLPGSAATGAAEELHRPVAGLSDDAALPGRQPVPRDRDAVHGEVHAGRRAQLPGSFAPQPRAVLRARRVAADLQAAVHGGGDGPLLPDRPLLPRRGPPPRSPAGVHADRSRDELRHRGRRAERRRGADGQPLEGRAGDRHPAPVPAPHLRRRDRQVRLGQARPALRAAARRPDRGGQEARRRRRRPACSRR